MVPYTIRCSNCRETRLGREKNGTIEPYKEACPHCGHDGFEILARSRDDDPDAAP